MKHKTLQRILTFSVFMTGLLSFLITHGISYSTASGSPLNINIISQQTSADNNQSIDPFYLTLFEEGKKAYFARRYTDACRQLEIAVFGLLKDKKLAAQAYLYLAVARFEMRQLEPSRMVMLEAAKLSKDVDFRQLELDETTLQVLRKATMTLNVLLPLPEKQSSAASDPVKVTLSAPSEIKKAEEPAQKTIVEAKPVVEKVNTGQTKAPEQAAKPLPTKKPDAEREKQQPVKTSQPTSQPPSQTQPKRVSSLPEKETTQDISQRIKTLESVVSREPKNSEFVHELCGLYFLQKKYRPAEKLLNEYTTKNPRDITAALLLAKATFFLGRYSEAHNILHRLSQPSNQAKMNEKNLFDLNVYLALALQNLGQVKTAQTYHKHIIDNTPPEELAVYLEKEGLTKAWSELRKLVSR